uniref:UDP-GlcNAc:betaGal beta-1,3-N-acetylglucosaminyltransferase-like protein 1 n=1 Tax=Phallusia mammillata TaxID=59560 RepID=A0A6F9D855_9ASCI|nr:UDP-GlcNAc:betaGal beta-1,3-N-acetylglucosaminyltransferase-like protein 1 [Phallusia mammillata]
MTDVKCIVSIILPVYNAESWIESCIVSILEQSYNGPLELCVHNDSCTDSTIPKLLDFKSALSKKGVDLILTQNENGFPKGCGYAKNRAVESSRGLYLCFLDADDVMMANRIQMQLDAARHLPKNTLVGCQVVREPKESTVRYTKWINSMTNEQLFTQMYTSNGPTIVMPTWFCHRHVFDLVGGFVEGQSGTPEDYIFFLRFMKLGGKLHRVNEVLLNYRHHPQATTHSISEHTIWQLRLKAVEKHVLTKWKTFTIWNAGKQGRKFYRDISDENKLKVSCFCDVDKKKINNGIYIHELSPKKNKPRVPIVHFSVAPKPFVICVKLGLTNGQFEDNLASLNLVEGEDYVVFS